MTSNTSVVATPSGLVRYALGPSLVAWLACAGLATALDHTRGLTSVSLGAGLVLAYFVAGMLVQRIALGRPDGATMALTMASYAVRVGGLGVILWWSRSTPTVADWLNNVWVAAGALTAVACWLLGLMIWHARARIPIYDRPYQPPPGWDQ